MIFAKKKKIYRTVWTLYNNHSKLNRFNQKLRQRRKKRRKNQSNVIDTTTKMFNSITDDIKSILEFIEIDKKVPALTFGYWNSIFHVGFLMFSHFWKSTLHMKKKNLLIFFQNHLLCICYFYHFKNEKECELDNNSSSSSSSMKKTS